VVHLRPVDLPVWPEDARRAEYAILVVAPVVERILPDSLAGASEVLKARWDHTISVASMVLFVKEIAWVRHMC